MERLFQIGESNAHLCCLASGVDIVGSHMTPIGPSHFSLPSVVDYLKLVVLRIVPLQNPQTTLLETGVGLMYVRCLLKVDIIQPKALRHAQCDGWQRPIE